MRRPPGTRVLLGALGGELEGGTPALRRRLFAVICVVVACELLVILAVGTRHTAAEPSSVAAPHAIAQTQGAERAAPASLRVP